MATTPLSTVDITWQGYLNALNPFSPTSLIWPGADTPQTDALATYNSQLAQQGLPGLWQQAKDFGHNAFFGIPGVGDFTNPLTQSQVSALGNNTYGDTIQAGGTPAQAQAAQQEVENYANNINQGDLITTKVSNTFGDFLQQLTAGLPSLAGLGGSVTAVVVIGIAVAVILLLRRR